MKKLQAFAALVALFLSSSLVAKDLIIAFAISPERQAHIHKHIVKFTGLGKKSPDKYHVTIGAVPNVEKADWKALKAYLKSELAQISKPYWDPKWNGIHATFVRGERYLVGGRKPDNCPIVLYPYENGNTEHMLRDINAKLMATLLHFNAPSKKVYKKFTSDLHPKNFQPHITLADTAYINNVKANRDSVIDKIQRNLTQFAAEQKKLGKDPSYTLALRI